MRVMALCIALAFYATGCATVPNPPVPSELPNPSMIVGTRACPKLNAQGGRACRFDKGHGHGFQVWPGRISILPVKGVPGVFLVTDTGHKDGMFDHTLRWRRDDHVTFQCFIDRNHRTFEGPTALKFQRGGVWTTYGEFIVEGAGIAGGAAVGFALGNAPGAAVGSAVGGIAGGQAAEHLGAELGKFGSRAWEPEAGNLAKDICSVLAGN